MSPTLEADRVSVRVDGRALVDEVSLEAEAGRLTVIVGPNGAGKSTLFRLLAGEARTSSGTVRYGGQDLSGVPAWRLAARRAVLPQASRLAFPFTAREVVRIGTDGIGRRHGPAERARIVAAALERADVAHLAGRSYQTLSGGEAQRVQFARVLAQLEAGRSAADGPQILLLDEPIASLDLKHQLALLGIATDLARNGAAVLAILHDLNLACAYADDLLAMRDGRVVRRGSPAAVLTDALLADVFGVALRVGAVPAGLPFVLPHR